MAFKVMEMIAKIKADTTDFDKGLKAADKKGQESATKAKKFGANISTAFKVVAAAGVVAFTKKLISMALEMEDAFQIQEVAITKLNAALESTGQFSDDVSADLQSFASELQSLTTVGDEASIELEQLAINAGLTADQAKTATEQAIGLSKAFNVDLKAAIKATTNAQQGNYDMLNRYIPAVKNASDESQKAAIAQESLAAAFEVAKAEALTATGVEQQLNNAIGDSKELVGAYVSEVLTPWRSRLLDIVTELNNAKTAQDNLNNVLSGGGGSLAGAMETQAAMVNAVSASLANGNKNLYNLAKQYGFALTRADEWLEKQKEILKSLENKALARGRELMTIDANEAAAVEAAKKEEERAAAAEAAELERLEGIRERVAERQELRTLEEMTNDAIAERAQRIREAEAEAEDAALAHKKELAESEMILNQQKLDSYQTFTNGFVELLQLGADTSTEAAIAAKVLSSAQAGINSYLAFTNALATVPYPFNIPAAAGVLASGLAQQIKIMSTPIPGFATGGIVGGTSTTGDNVPARLNSKEMVLTQRQQSELFNMANGAGGGGGGTYILQLPDGTELARWMVDNINSGQGGVIKSRAIGA